ncbi:hypothetical protein HY949_03910 [Candidatus Gottesmanbacteria bacterium]|nr:hypothetical protein [Candidatus Gottesmanbacteria bacterium]
MHTLLKPIKVREDLLRRKMRIFTGREFMRVFPVPDYVAKYFLETQVHGGLFMRLKRGLYALQTDPPAEEEIANAIYKPSYISFEYALSYYHVIPETVYTVTSTTTKATRVFSVGHTAFSYRSIKTESYTGYTLQTQANKIFLIAEPEKALVDYLYFVTLKKSPDNERFVLTGLNAKKIREYASLFRWEPLNRRIRSLL